MSVTGRPKPYRFPDEKAVRAVLHQLVVDRTVSAYWSGRWAEDQGDQHIEAWLRDLLDWLGADDAYAVESTPRPKEATA